MKLGRYEVVRELGRGAMGVVYLAKDPLIGRLVALKTIRLSAHTDDDEAKEFQQRFIREAQAAGIINHPAIVTVFDIGSDEATDTSFIAMEFVEGQNLKQILVEGRQLSYEQIADFLSQIADALDFAHSKGIVHRDVKPANIMIDGTRAKITDFGIAKIASGAANLTATGQFLGTPNYMAPEQIRGAPVDGRTDTFALGITLYECLTHRKPFGGDSLTSISYKIVHEPYPPLRTVNAQIPVAFDDVVAKCLAKHPAKRYQRARDVADALRAIAQGEQHFMDESGGKDGDEPSVLDDTAVDADGHEQRARARLAGHSYRDALKELKWAIARDAEREARIKNEFGFLYALEPEARAGSSGARDRLRWCTNLWRLLTRSVAGELQITALPREAEPAAIVPALNEVRDHKPPQTKGEELEEAAVRLFRRFFSLAEQETDVRLQLKKLRRQKAGAQFGYDVAFEADVVGEGSVRCHVECKNYGSPISLKDIADKLLQQKSHGASIDHWILISPHTDPTQELHHFLERESKDLDFPFDIHVWSPESGVDQFFGLEPLLYEQFYANDGSEEHPRDWTEERQALVVERYRRFMRPVYRLPPGWKDYIDSERYLCFSDAERLDFERTYQQFVPLGVKDQNGVELAGTAQERLLKWLRESSAHVAFILAEFGDGKSFLTYTLCKELLAAFRRDPQSGIIPIRLALREFKDATSVREFLQARLELFSADASGWSALKRRYKTLVILDGFDEISKELDPQTITNNIGDLIDCCTAPIFNDSKILITSRTHFFETGDASRLLERLDHPLLLQLGRIPRGQVLGHLKEAAKGAEGRELLDRLSQMHDPIGLGTKPLFLQMLKATLEELPADLDEVSVYESYARRTLERKIDMLDDPEFRSSPGHSVQQLMMILGIIAEELQRSTTPYVSLSDLRNVTGPFAALLWRLTGDDRLESDAEARVGARSLLSRVKGLSGSGEWLVDFSHRSIREYFVARRFAAYLSDSPAQTTQFLKRVPVNYEILSFTAGLLRRSRDPKALRSLRELIESSRAGKDDYGLGGKALTVLLRVSPVLPRDIDFRRRNFDFADLEDANLSGLDFSKSTFRSANFANTNIEHANLSKCDLTDARLQETTSVLAVAASSAALIFAAYEDGTIWEWDLENGAKPAGRIVFVEQGLRLSRLGVTRNAVPWGIAGREVLLFERGAGTWKCMARIRMHQRCADFQVDDQSIVVLLADKNPRCLLADLDHDTFSIDVALPESSAFVSPMPGLLCFRSGETTVSIVGRGLDSNLEVGNATALHASWQSQGEILVAVGENTGFLRVFAVTFLDAAVEATPLLLDNVHSGPILSLMFCDGETVASGGLDRTIAVTRFGRAAPIKQRLQRSLRCVGVKTAGLIPESQRKRLEDLKARDLQRQT